MQWITKDQSDLWKRDKEELNVFFSSFKKRYIQLPCTQARLKVVMNDIQGYFQHQNDSLCWKLSKHIISRFSSKWSMNNLFSFKLVADTIPANFHGFYFEVWRLTLGPDISSNDVSWPNHVDKVNQKVACGLTQICTELQRLENLQTNSINVDFFLWTQSRKNLIRLHLKFQVAY